MVFKWRFHVVFCHDASWYFGFSVINMTGEFEKMKFPLRKVLIAIWSDFDQQERMSGLSADIPFNKLNTQSR